MAIAYKKEKKYKLKIHKLTKKYLKHQNYTVLAMVLAMAYYSVHTE